VHAQAIWFLTMLIIFDCDGVLVDSELISSRELAAFLSDLGRPTTAEECRENFTGLSLKSVSDMVRDDWGVALPDDFITALRARDQTAFDRDLKAIPGIHKMLDVLDGLGMRYCVASSGSPEKIQHSLMLTSLTERFGDDVFSASNVAHGKPAPDLFLWAAETMGAAPADCLVIEDSPAGVQAAKAAGMRVFGFTGGAHCGAGADAVFDDMAALGALL